MNYMHTLIGVFSILICVNGLNKNYYFLNEQQNGDEEWSSREQVDEYEKESNENNDFKFDDQSTFKDSDEEEKDAANELYQFWNNIDMCNDVSCKDSQVCVINRQNVAVCVERNDLQREDSRSPGKAIKQKCNECVNLKTNDIYCASNNRSYSSLCELIKFNCERSTEFYPLCQDECPCSTKLNLNKKLKLDYLWKYVNNLQFSRRSDHTVVERKNKIERNRSNRNKSNNILSQRQKNRKQTPKNTCSSKELNEMGQRLFNWFKVILKNQLSNENERSIKILNKIRASSSENCDLEVNFMFLNLDANKDLKLSLDELYHLEHDQREKCLKVYMDSCDTNADRMLDNNEWCNCFTPYRPCLKERNLLLYNRSRNNNRLSANYVPNCDQNGYFVAMQCNKSTKFCWCVDKNGNEIANSRKFGKVFCDKAKINRKIHPIDDDSEGDDDFEDYQTETEGSGD